MKHIKKVGALLLCAAVLIALAAWLAPETTYGRAYLRQLRTNHFTLEGTMAIPNGDDRVLVPGVVERCDGTDYSILYPESHSFAIIDGTYYFGARADCIEPIDPPSSEEVAQYQEMIYLKSAFSVCRGDFSQMTFASRTETELPTPSGDEMVLCTCEEYLVSDPDVSVRMYFTGHQLYAIQGTVYPETTFYVTSFSPQCEGVL